MSKNQANILIVDDTPANLQLLSDMLKARGYKVRPVPSGKLALQATELDPPDLILLDINMPELNGYEVCKRLKANPRFAEIPILFISALTDTEDKVRAFHAGGVDYVTKPFQFEEVEARVQTHLELRRQKQELRESYEKLQDLERLRDSLVHMIVHDMRTPLTGISGFLELSAMQELPPKVAGYVSRARVSTDALIDMVSSLLDVNKMESGEMELDLTEYDMGSLVQEALAKVESLKGERQITVSTPAAPVTLTCDAGQISRVVQNLLGNALKFTPKDGAIQMRLFPAGEALRVEVEDTGPGIPEEYRARIFEKFGQVESREQKQKFSTGLGLAFCKLAVEAHGGRIGVDSEVGKGSTFWFVLPRTAASVNREGDAG